MHKYTVSYVPHFSEDGRSIQKTLYFNLSLAEMQRMIHIEGWGEKLQKMSEFDIEKLEDRKLLLTTWEDLLRRAYGQRDGEDFMQSESLSERFLQSQAYDALIEDMFFTDDSKVASTFLTALFPRKVMEQIEKDEAKTVQVSDLERRVAERGE